MLKKIISLVVVSCFFITTTMSAFANDVDVSEKALASVVLEEVVNEIVEVNNLSPEMKSVVEKSIREKISVMDKSALMELRESIKNLAAEKKEIDEQNNTRDIPVVKGDITTKSQQGMVELVYVGLTLAKLTGYMLMCDEAGSKLIDAIVVAGGGAATIGLGIATAAPCTIGIGIATALGGYLALQWGMIKIQLYFNDIAVAYI